MKSKEVKDEVLAEALYETSRRVFSTGEPQLVMELNLIRDYIDLYSGHFHTPGGRANVNKNLLLRVDPFGKIMKRMCSILNVYPDLNMENHGTLKQFLINFWGGSTHIRQIITNNNFGKTVVQINSKN